MAFFEKTEQLISSGDANARDINDLNEKVKGKWRRLVGLTEERNKLIKAAISCYKTFQHGVNCSFFFFTLIFVLILSALQFMLRQFSKHNFLVL